jgi:iron(III) transport system ATP-binding protein
VSGPLLELRDLGKSYAPGLPPVLSGLNLSVQAGELLTLLGPSGCGKTTTLRLIAGLERPDEGEIWLDGQLLAGRLLAGRLLAGTLLAGPEVFAPPERRGVGLVFQDFALFPHLNVRQNVAFGLSALPRSERQARVSDTLALVGLTIFEKRFPHQLSGGQQQRVALARALAPWPAVLLLDEPFSNLDAALRHDTRQEVRSLLRSAATTALLVTHDQDEALAFSDRLLVMRGGMVEQLGTPQELYTQPRTAFVAGFLGRSNLLSGTAHGLYADTAAGRVPLSEPSHGAVLVSLRPEHLRLARAAPTPGAPALRVLSQTYRGRDASYELRLSGQGPVLEVDGEPGEFAAGEEVWLEVRVPGRVVR